MKKNQKNLQPRNFKKQVILFFGICSVLIVLLFVLNQTFAITSWYEDLDKDGFGNKEESIRARFKPDGFVYNNEDTDDQDPCIPNRSQECETVEQKQVDNREEVIKKLINAENKRDINSLKQIFRSHTITYFSQSNISIDELLGFYTKIWDRTRTAENKVRSISKIRNDRYEYITEFKWVSNSGKTGVSIDTIIVQFDSEEIISVRKK